MGFITRQDDPIQGRAHERGPKVVDLRPAVDAIGLILYIRANGAPWPSPLAVAFRANGRYAS